jgi:predicted DNA-binding transcriptional regulator YafY
MNRGFGIMNELNKEEPGREVVLKFTGTAARLTDGLVWHPSQSVSWDEKEESRQFTFPVSSWEEVLNRVFSYREEAEIVAPEELRELWKGKIRKMAGNYL